MARPESNAPQRIGDFCIERQISAGGMGIVYLARQLSLNRLVALKVLGPSLTRETDKARFRREAQAIAKLKHPNIPAIYFVGQDLRLCYLAVEFVDGVSLREVIDALARATEPDSSIDDFVKPSVVNESALERFDEPAPTVALGEGTDSEPPFARTPEAEHCIGRTQHIRRCCTIIRDVAFALQHAHERGVIHRDVKPDNLMIDREGKVHVVDFGLATFFESETLTRSGQLLGTPAYMSPEQVTGRFALDHRTDVYSLGMVLYELLTLRPAITPMAREGMFRMILAKNLVPVSWRNEAVPSDLENVVHKATARDAENRYESAEHFAEDLQNVLDNAPVLAARYRYRCDVSEINATRPSGVTVLALGWLSIAIVVATSIPLIAIPTVQSIFRAPDATAALGITLLVSITGTTVVASGLNAWGLLSGRPWARWTATLGILPLFAMSILSIMNIFVLPCWVIPLFGPFVVFRKRVSNWFRFARNLRAERGRKSHTRVGRTRIATRGRVQP